ncbi:hypothetical protein ACFQ9X_24950 [Catenulispora yoronensis]
MVVHAPQNGVLTRTVAEGCYRQTGCGLRAVERRPLAELGDDEALIWPHARVGDRVERGDEVALIQVSGHVADIAITPTLSERGRSWLDAVAAQTEFGP